MKPTDKNRKSERGTQLLELAIVLPLLLFLAMLVSEGSDFIRVHQILNNAAREGAKFSSMAENDCTAASAPATCLTAIKNVAVRYANNNGVNITAANVDVNQGDDPATQIRVVPAGAASGFVMSQVTVTYSYPIVYLRIAPGFNIPTSVLLKGVSLFRNFYGSSS